MPAPITSTFTPSTYDQARDWVLASAGFGGNCPLDDEVLDVLMLDCLEQIYTQVWDDKRYQRTWEFEVAEGNCTVQGPTCDENGDPILDDDGNPVLEDLTTTQIFDPEWRIVNKLVRDSDCKEFYKARSPLTKCEPEVEAAAGTGATSYPGKFELYSDFEKPEDGKAVPFFGKVEKVTETPLPPRRKAERCEWSCWGDDFLINPPAAKDEAFTLYGYRDLNRQLFETEEMFDEDGELTGVKITWQEIDLPAEYIAPFMKCVLGFVYANCDDPQMSAYWLQVAASEIEAISTMNDGADTDNDPACDEPLVIGGAKKDPYTCTTPPLAFEVLDGSLSDLSGDW